MMWLKYAGTIEIIIALSSMYEKVPPLGKPRLQYREIDEMLYLGVGGEGMSRGRHGEGKKNEEFLTTLERKIKRSENMRLLKICR